MWYIICDGRVITCTQTIANMMVVDDRAMTNVHVVDNRLLWPINGGLHAVVLSRMVRERFIACDSDFGYRKPNDFRTKQ